MKETAFNKIFDELSIVLDNSLNDLKKVYSLCDESFSDRPEIEYRNFILDEKSCSLEENIRELSKIVRNIETLLNYANARGARIFKKSVIDFIK